MNIGYIFNLYRQYCLAVGKVYDKFNLLNDDDFFLWIKLLKTQTEIYSYYLEYLDVNLSSDSSMEIGKGKYDSIGSSLVTMVSPYADTLGYRNSDITVCGNIPYVIMGTSIYDASNCEMFLTHNSYDSIISKLISLHECNYSICVGFYGSISDKDKNDKLNMLENILKECCDNLELSSDTLDGNYFSCIRSKWKVKRRILTR